MRAHEFIISELNVSQTLKFIQQAHGNQLYGKLPYWTHPRAVAMTGRKVFGTKFNSDAVKTAFLHDVVEDTHIGLDELAKLNFAPEVIQAVGLLTKDKSLGYSQNIERIINSGNELAMMVKYADNYENFSGDKSDWDPKRAASSQKKYFTSLNMLGDKLGVKHHIGENFADGKKPGRKGLAKRSGVNTKASVSSLRKTAKNSSGEKARMAHWLANMKAGRAKKEDLDLEEGWKDWVAGAALGAAALGASGDAEAAKKRPTEKPSVIQQVSKADLAKSVTGNPHEVVLKKAAQKAGIQGNELAAFLSQCAHETMDFKYMKEIGGGLDFKKYDIRFAPNKAKTLGNTKPGDGAKYKGRGYIHLTGKYNYAAASKAIYGDDRLVKDPSLVEKPEIAAKTSVWFWQNRVQDKVKNFNNVKDVTKGINPGLKHLDQRKDKFNTFQVAMK